MADTQRTQLAAPAGSRVRSIQENAIRYLRIVRLVPICPTCKKPMGRYSGGPGRRVYYACKACKQSAPGETTREFL